MFGHGDFQMLKNMSLAHVKQGVTYTVVGFDDSASAYAEKLIKMGFVPGTQITLAPVKLPDPMVFQIRGSRIALRKDEAKQVLVKEVAYA